MSATCPVFIDASNLELRDSCAEKRYRENSEGGGTTTKSSLSGNMERTYLAVNAILVVV